MPYIITITGADYFGLPQPKEVEHYKRRVDIDDLQTTIRAIDAALNVKARKPRRDKGTTRTEASPV